MAVNAAKTAPCGSLSTAMRPTSGMLMGSTRTLAPSSLACSTVASVSGVEMYASQWGGAPPALASSGRSMIPPTGASPMVNIV